MTIIEITASQIRIIVLDSIAFHFRHDMQNMIQRTRLLNGLSQDLLHLATSRELAVCIHCSF